MLLFTPISMAIDVPSSQAVNLDKNKVLRIIGWDVYADPIYTNKTIGYKKFEKKYGVTIEFTPLSNLEDIINAAESGNHYDVIIISNEGVHTLEQMNLVLPLKLNKIPNYRDLYPSLKSNKWIRKGNNVYAVPWAWGPTGLLFDTDTISEPNSWNILWEPQYQGKVSLWNDVSMIWTTALALGYKNVYNLTRQQLLEVKNKLFKLNNQIYGYYGGGEEAFDFIHNENIIILNSWFDPSARLKTIDHNFKMVIPKEGAVGMFDSYLISSKSKKINLAYEFINSQIKPGIQKEMFEITGLVPANSKTEKLLTKDEIKSLHLDEDDYFDKMLLWDIMPRKHLYDEVLKEVHLDLQKKLRASTVLELIRAEQNWIRDNPIVNFTGNPNWLPFEAFQEDGVFIGIVADHLKLIENSSGLTLRSVPAKSWSESLSNAKKGKVSIVSGDLSNTILNQDFKPLPPYSNNPVVIIMDSHQNYIENLNEIKNKKIAIIKNYGYTTNIYKQYPGFKFFVVENIQEGLNGVASGRFDAMLASHALASYTISEMSLNDVTIVGKTPINMNLTLFVAKNQPQLFSIINKALKSISVSTSHDIFHKWSKYKYVEKTDYTLVYQVIFASVVLIIIFLFWNRRLSQEVELRKKTETKLGQFKHALDQTLDSVFMFNVPDLQYIYANDGAVEHLGYSHDELLTMHPYDIKPDFSESHFRNFISPLLSGNKKSIDFEDRHRHKDGNIILVEIFLQYIQSDIDEDRFVAIIRDITERKKTEAKLKDHSLLLEDQVQERTKELVTARDDAERANATKSEFLSRMSHELRTPMNAILGFSQLLEQNPYDDMSESSLDSVDEILKAGYHLLELINEVLDLSQVESGKLHLTNDFFDLTRIVNECITLIMPLAKKSNITITHEKDDEAPIVYVDHVRFKQIILNLLANAVKYNHENGKIVLSYNIDNDKVKLLIKDTGIGIADDMYHRVFKPFDRLNANSTSIEGTGIGLSLAKSMIELMHGSIGFESTKGQGSTFWVEINLAAENSVPKDISAKTTSETSIDGEFSVLYVEDNPANLRLVSRVLNQQGGITLYDAHKASLAMDLLSTKTFDLILLDIQLPGDGDGFTILRKIKANSKTCDIPVIAVSANATDHDIKEGLDAGFNDYITKPINIEQFIKTINVFLK